MVCEMEDAGHGDVVEYFGRDGRVGMYDVATPAAGCAPTPQGVVVFDGEDGGVAGFDDADVIHDFDGSGDVGGRGIGVRHDLAEGVVSPCPGRAVFFDGV